MPQNPNHLLLPDSDQELENNHAIRELERRTSAGYNVALLWNRVEDKLLVVLNLPVSHTRIEMPIEAERDARVQQARAVYEHPFAFAAQSGQLPEEILFKPTSHAA